MRKYLLSLCLLLITAAVWGQKKSIVNLVRSNSSTGIKLNGKDVIKVYRGTFKQDYSTLTSDSAYFYPQDNAFDAFGHVNINQGDTLNIYSDKLNYNGNTKTAILTDNVRMVDKDATLTTNHLTYNTATRIGVYTDGGKLVNKDNTLLSKNGYYFAFSRDSYFRYNVSLTTPDALVKTDTMRYNTGSKIAFFYGPTDIYSIKKGEKEKDTLYTENGYYNTVVEQAAFGKKNLYRSGTKSLKGDSLFYDKIKGYGRAVRRVTFIDKEQKITIKGDLGTYYKADERTLVTKDPYVILVTEEKDTAKTGQLANADSLVKKTPGKGKPAIDMAGMIKKTIPVKDVPLPAVPKDLPAQAKIDSIVRNKDAALAAGMANDRALSKSDTLTGLQKASAAKPLVREAAPLNKKNAALKKMVKPDKNKAVLKGDGKMAPELKLAVKDTGKTKIDSIYMSADTIETQILTYKDLKLYQEKQRLAHVRDTTAKPKKLKAALKESKFLTATFIGVPKDTINYHRDYFGKPKPVYVKKKVVKPPTKKQLMLDSLRKKQEADSAFEAKKLEPSDTARIRIIIAHHHAKLFKSDLQAKADSMFYANSDSTLRCYVNPIIWTEGSQLTGDTIYLQMKHKKLDNMTMFPAAFIVNIEKDDSVHFNQVAGKLMHGFFKDDKLSRMLIIGNAESIYFSRDSGKNTVSGMERSLSSRIRVDFKDNKATNLAFYTKPQHTYGPLNKFTEEDKILKGFIWKPKERPISKESIIPSYNKKKAAEKSPAGRSKKGKVPIKQLPGQKTPRDSVRNIPSVKTDSLQNAADRKTLLKTAKDTSAKSASPKSPAVKESVIKKP